MVMPQVVTGGDPIFPKAEYPIQVMKQEMKTFEFGPSIVVDMMIVDGPYRGAKVDKLFNIEKGSQLDPKTGIYVETLKINPRSFYAGFLRILDIAFPDQIGVPVQYDQAVGRYAIVTIEPKEDKKTGGLRNNVTAWRRYTGTTGNAPVAGQQPGAPVSYPPPTAPAAVPGPAVAAPVAPVAQPAAPAYPPAPAANPVLPTGTVPKW